MTAEENDSKKIKELEKSIEDLKNKVRKLEETDRRLYESVISTSKDSIFWNKVTSFATCASVALSAVGLIVGLVTRRG
jgi:hypothetical protein